MWKGCDYLLQSRTPRPGRGGAQKARLQRQGCWPLSSNGKYAFLATSVESSSALSKTNRVCAHVVSEKTDFVLPRGYTLVVGGFEFGPFMRDTSLLKVRSEDTYGSIIAQMMLPQSMSDLTATYLQDWGVRDCSYRMLRPISGSRSIHLSNRTPQFPKEENEASTHAYLRASWEGASAHDITCVLAGSLPRAPSAHSKSMAPKPDTIAGHIYRCPRRKRPYCEDGAGSARRRIGRRPFYGNFFCGLQTSLHGTLGNEASSISGTRALVEAARNPLMLVCVARRVRLSPSGDHGTQIPCFCPRKSKAVSRMLPTNLATNPDLLDFVPYPLAIHRLDSSELSKAYMLMDSVLQTRLAYKDVSWSMADCVAEASRHFAHLGPVLSCVYSQMRSLVYLRLRLSLSRALFIPGLRHFQSTNAPLHWVSAWLMRLLHRHIQLSTGLNPLARFAACRLDLLEALFLLEPLDGICLPLLI